MYSLGTHVVKLRNEPYPKAVLVRYGSVACAVVDVMFVQSVFSANVVAVVFVVSVFLSLVLPKDMDIKRVEEK